MKKYFIQFLYFIAIFAIMVGVSYAFDFFIESEEKNVGVPFYAVSAGAVAVFSLFLGEGIFKNNSQKENLKILSIVCIFMIIFTICLAIFSENVKMGRAVAQCITYPLVAWLGYWIGKKLLKKSVKTKE
jgi:cytochrome c biogenesis factor